MTGQNGSDAMAGDPVDRIEAEPFVPPARQEGEQSAPYPEKLKTQEGNRGAVTPAGQGATGRMGVT